MPLLGPIREAGGTLPATQTPTPTPSTATRAPIAPTTQQVMAALASLQTPTYGQTKNAEVQATSTRSPYLDPGMTPPSTIQAPSVPMTTSRVPGRPLPTETAPTVEKGPVEQRVPRPPTVIPTEVTGPTGPTAVAAMAPDIPGLDPMSNLQSLTETELSSLLDGIAARYGLTRAQLSQQKDAVGNAARSLEQQLEFARRDAIKGARESALERGVLRSGLHARNVAAIDTNIAQQGQQVAQDTSLQQGQIESALARLDQQSASEQAAARTASDQGMLQFRQGQTVADLLAQLPPVPQAPPGPVLPAAPVLTDPSIPSQPSNASVFGSSTYNPTASNLPDLTNLTPAQIAAYLGFLGGGNPGLVL